MKEERKTFDVSDLFIILGSGLVTLGLWLTYPPVAIIGAGIALIYLGLTSGPRGGTG